MNGLQKVYLDSNAIVKRYVKERGTHAVNLAYSKASLADLTLAFSLWNVGEVIGVLDTYKQRGWISQPNYDKAITLFANETLRLARIAMLQVIPLYGYLLVDAWKLIPRHHLYEADAIQISTSKHTEARLLLTADKRLAQAAIAEGLNAINVEDEDEKAIRILEKNF